LHQLFNDNFCSLALLNICLNPDFSVVESALSTVINGGASSGVKSLEVFTNRGNHGLLILR
jgi:hypothetical protein